MQWPGIMQSTHARWEAVDCESTNETQTKPGEKRTLPLLDPVYARNFRIHDFCLETAPDSSLCDPGSSELDNSLSSISSQVLEELPSDCLQALQVAIRRETSWRNKWHTERIDGLRAQIAPSVEWFPK